jgi:FMN reductase
MPNIKIIGLGGSLKPGSASVLALKEALVGAEEAGASIELLELHALDLPMFVPDSKPPEQVHRFVDSVATAAGMVWSSPVYHGSMSGAFKNALDWLELLSKHEPPYLSDKIVGLIATAGGVQGLQAINAMEFAVRSLRGYTHPLTAPLDRAWQLFDKNGAFSDEPTILRLRTIGRGVAEAAKRMSAAR